MDPELYHLSLQKWIERRGSDRLRSVQILCVLRAWLGRPLYGCAKLSTEDQIGYYSNVIGDGGLKCGLPYDAPGHYGYTSFLYRVDAPSLEWRT